VSSLRRLAVRQPAGLPAGGGDVTIPERPAKLTTIMASEADKIKFLREHLAYERQMLGYSFREIHSEIDQLRWNALFESFSVHARNLYDFLRSDGGARSLHADDYVRAHKAPELRVFNKLDVYVFHTAKQRLANKKFDLADAAEAGTWLDVQWARWVAALPQEFSGFASAAPVCKVSDAVAAALSPKSQITTTTSTGAVTISGFSVTPPPYILIPRGKK
jgi:hypothetical protein